MDNIITEIKRSELPDSVFGIPEERKYPLHDEKHVRSAIKLFNHVDQKYEKQLANKIIAKMKEYDITPNIGDNNRLKKYINESVILESSKRNLYHLSESNLDRKTLQPRVPSNFLVKNGYEDSTSKRVCFTSSIDKALRAMSQNLKGKELYVHIPAKEYETYKPSLKEVPDSKVTGEVWIKEPVKLECIGKIKVTEDRGEDGIPYIYGDNKTAELYDWNWEWIEKYITEFSTITAVTSSIDKDHKQKGTKSLSDFHKLKITKEVINSLKDKYDCLKHIDYRDDAYAFFDGDTKLVGVVAVDHKDSDYEDGDWITALEVSKEYQGYGLGTQLLEFAVKNLHADSLSVNRNNEVAIRMYEKYGFKYNKNDTGDMIYMHLKTVSLEGVITNSKDIYYNKDKFDSGQINLCFITGHSGSGKSTMARVMKDVEHYELDDVIANKMSFTIEQLKDYGDLIYSFFSGRGKKYYYIKKDIDEGKMKPIDGDYDKQLIVDFVDYSISYAKSHKNNKFVIEGIWLYEYIEPSILKDYAVYIKGTSALLSTIRAASRDSKNDYPDDKDKIKRFKSWMNRFSILIKKSDSGANSGIMNIEKKIKKYRDYFSKKEYISESQVDLTKFTWYHAEIAKKGFNAKTAGGWDEELYSKDIESCIHNDIEGKAEFKGSDKLSAHLYTAGEDLSAIYLGRISIWRASDNNKLNWEWEEQIPMKSSDVAYLKDEVQPHLLESTILNEGLFKKDPRDNILKQYRRDMTWDHYDAIKDSKSYASKFKNAIDSKCNSLQGYKSFIINDQYSSEVEIAIDVAYSERFKLANIMKKFSIGNIIKTGDLNEDHVYSLYEGNILFIDRGLNNMDDNGASRMGMTTTFHLVYSIEDKKYNNIEVSEVANLLKYCSNPSRFVYTSVGFVRILLDKISDSEKETLKNSNTVYIKRDFGYIINPKLVVHESSEYIEEGYLNQLFMSVPIKAYNNKNKTPINNMGDLLKYHKNPGLVNYVKNCKKIEDLRYIKKDSGSHMIIPQVNKIKERISLCKELGECDKTKSYYKGIKKLYLDRGITEKDCDAIIEWCKELDKLIADKIIELKKAQTNESTIIVEAKKSDYSFRRVSTVKEIDLYKKWLFDIFKSNEPMPDKDIKQYMEMIYYKNKHIGFVSGKPCKGYSQYCFISNFMIFPEYQRKGHGKNSIREYIEQHKDTYDNFFCYVDMYDTKAISFYKSLGADINMEKPFIDHYYYVVLYDNIYGGANILNESSEYITEGLGVLEITFLIFFAAVQGFVGYEQAKEYFAKRKQEKGYRYYCSNSPLTKIPNYHHFNDIIRNAKDSLIFHAYDMGVRKGEKNTLIYNNKSNLDKEVYMYRYTWKDKKLELVKKDKYSNLCSQYGIKLKELDESKLKDREKSYKLAIGEMKKEIVKYIDLKKHCKVGPSYEDEYTEFCNGLEDSVIILNGDVWDIVHNARSDEGQDLIMSKIRDPEKEIMDTINKKLPNGYKLEEHGDWDDICIVLVHNSKVHETTEYVNENRDNLKQLNLFKHQFSAKDLIPLSGSLVKALQIIGENKEQVLRKINNKKYLSTYRRLSLPINIHKYANQNTDLSNYSEKFDKDNTTGFIFVDGSTFVASIAVASYNNDRVIDSVIINDKYVSHGLFHQLIDCAVMDLNADTVYSTFKSKTCNDIYIKCGFSNHYNIDADVVKMKQKSFKPFSKANKKPLFIVTSYSKSKLGDMIVSVTKSYFSHASIALDSNLENMYSFGVNEEKTDSGIIKENLRLFKKRDSIIRVNCIFLNPSDYTSIITEIENIENGKSEYNFKGLIDVLDNKTTETDGIRMMCSQFVSHILNKIGIDVNYKPSNLVTPDDVSKMCDNNDRVYKLYEGPATTYDFKTVNGRLKNISPKAFIINESLVEDYLDDDEWDMEVEEWSPVSFLSKRTRQAKNRKAHRNYLRKKQKSHPKKYNFFHAHESVILYEDTLAKIINAEPIFIVTSFTNTAFGKLISSYTHSAYSHSAISLDSSLTHLYTFSADNKKNIFGGFAIESINDYIAHYKDAIIQVNCIFVKKEDMKKIKIVLDNMIENVSDTKYGYRNIFNIILNKSKGMSNNAVSMICSQFVTYVLHTADIELLDKSDNLVTPKDLSTLSNPRVYKLYEGKAIDYDEKKINRIFRKLKTKAMIIKESLIDY